jgi:hypothetical protein
METGKNLLFQKENLFAGAGQISGGGASSGTAANDQRVVIVLAHQLTMPVIFLEKLRDGKAENRLAAGSMEETLPRLECNVECG